MTFCLHGLSGKHWVLEDLKRYLIEFHDLSKIKGSLVLNIEGLGQMAYMKKHKDMRVLGVLCFNRIE